MKVFFAGSEVMQIPNIPISLGKMGHEVLLYDKSMEYVEEHEEEYELFLQYLTAQKPELVISTIFFQIVAAYTHRLGIRYAVYGMDSPHYAAWVPEYPMLDNVTLFHFDSREAELFREHGYRNVKYLPLAAGVTWADTVRATSAERRAFASDVSFVGGLYGENPFDRYGGSLPDAAKESIWTLLEQAAFQWDGTDRLLCGVTPELVQACRETEGLRNHGLVMEDAYYLRQWVLARKLTHLERSLLLEQIAEEHDFRLYTREGESVPEGIRRCPPVNAMTEQLKVFQSSRINLNLTLRSIESGVPLRVFDIMSVGGFVLTDYRADAEELFRVDEELVMFATPEELMDKLNYYLGHEAAREKVAARGQKAVREKYSYERMLGEILDQV